MAIDIKTSEKTAYDIKADLLIIPVDSSLDIKSSLSHKDKEYLKKNLKKKEFKGLWAKVELMMSPPGIDALFVAVVCIGDNRGKQAEALRRGLAKALQDARRHSLRNVTVDLFGHNQAALLAQAAVESAALTNYRFTKYSKALTREQKVRSLEKMTLITEAKNVSRIKEVIRRSQAIMSGVKLARNLVNQPPSNMSPRHLVEVANAVNKTSDDFSLKVLDKKKAAEEGFSAFLDVAKGSEEEPYVIHLTYKPKKKTKKKIMLVGKGITFDSGGLSLKPAAFMEAMKMDMAGAATVMGVMSVLPDLQIDAQVHGIMPVCENMPSGSAYRPGDILTARNGKTIEVINTDAEGRIILADALSYAIDQKPDAVIDFATLTGACLVALGETHAGLFGNDEKLKESLLQSAMATGEGLTALPLPEEYRPFIQSKVADVRNMSTSRYGGAIAAALFLEEFAGDANWAHIDLAGPSFAESASLPYHSYGGTGYGIRTVVDWLSR